MTAARLAPLGSLAVHLALSAFAADNPSRAPLPVSQATGIPQVWQPHQHLYVKGNVGASPSRLEELEQWLDENAPNWTIALLESAASESFTDATGRAHSGIDAVEFALGQGLPNQTDFGRLRDPRTQEPSGAWFALFLRERKFSYFGSEAQDRRGLGEDRWQGHLDAPAISAMRGGGRIVDAVKDTVSNIDRRLSEAIAAEERARQADKLAAESRRKLALENAQRSLAEWVELIQQVAAGAAAFHQKHPSAAGPLANPPLERWRGELAAARAAFEASDLDSVLRQTEPGLAAAREFLRSYEDFEAAAVRLQALKSRLSALQKDPQAPAARRELENAASELNQASARRENGDPQYQNDLRAADKSLASAQAILRAAARAERSAQRLKVLLGGSFAGGLFALAIILNLRRRGDKKEALDLLTAWEKGLIDKNQGLVELLDRASTLLGNSREQAAQRFSGATLDLAGQIIRDVDELFIMASCAGRVWTKAKNEALPSLSAARLANLFSPGHYRQAIRLLRDEPVVFAPEDKLDLIIAGPGSTRKSLLGTIDSYRPFSMSFNQLVAEFNQRAARAFDSLEKVAQSLSAAAPFLKQTAEAVERAAAQAQELKTACERDGMFETPALAGELIPSARLLHAQASELSLLDPVGALATNAAQARQQAEDALKLSGAILQFRAQLLPQAMAGRDELAAAGLQTGWAGQAIEALSAEADGLARAALTSSASAAIEQFSARLREFSQRVERAAALERTRSTASVQSIAGIRRQASEARRGLSARHGLAEACLLREPDRDPDILMTQADEQSLAAKAGLERGDVEAAERALASVQELAAQADEIIQATSNFAARYEDEDKRLRQARTELLRLLPEHERILESIRVAYVPAVLALGAGDPTHPAANGTIADNLEESSSHLNAAGELLAQAGRHFQAGQILQSAELLRRVEGLIETTRFRLDEIQAKHKRLKQLQIENAQILGGLEGRAAAVAPAIQEAVTTGETIAAHADLQRQFVLAQAGLVAAPNDPFDTRALLDIISNQLDRIGDFLASDRKHFAEAQERLGQARSNLQTAQRLAQRSATDQIADSRAVTESVREIKELEARLAEVGRRLAEPHGGWKQISAEAEAICSACSRQAARLQGELEKAEQAIALLNAAGEALRCCGGWRGRYGVRIHRHHGAEALAEAQRLILLGLYDEAWRNAEAARTQAQTALARAEAEEARLHQEELARLERERRRREIEEARRRASWSSSSGGGRSSFGSGSGSSRSSFSSGSGSSRSGW